MNKLLISIVLDLVLLVVRLIASSTDEKSPV